MDHREQIAACLERARLVKSRLRGEDVQVADNQGQEAKPHWHIETLTLTSRFVSSFFSL